MLTPTQGLPEEQKETFKKAYQPFVDMVNAESAAAAAEGTTPAHQDMIPRVANFERSVLNLDVPAGGSAPLSAVLPGISDDDLLFSLTVAAIGEDGAAAAGPSSAPAAGKAAAAPAAGKAAAAPAAGKAAAAPAAGKAAKAAASTSSDESGSSSSDDEEDEEARRKRKKAEKKERKRKRREAEKAAKAAGGSEHKKHKKHDK